MKNVNSYILCMDDSYKDWVLLCKKIAYDFAR